MNRCPVCTSAKPSLLLRPQPRPPPHPGEGWVPLAPQPHPRSHREATGQWGNKAPHALRSPEPVFYRENVGFVLWKVPKWMS